MAENLLWLANERYPDRKIIVWLATMHGIRAPEAPSFLSDHRMVASVFPSMGESIGKAMGSANFVIGVTSHRDPGAGMFPDQDLPLPQFEELMVASGFDYGFLDLRRAGDEGAWPGSEFLARPLAQVSGAAVWSDLLDALLFVREHEPRQNVDPPAGDMDAISQVRQSETNAFLSGDPDSYVALFTEDCVVIPPGESRMEGHAALKSWLQHLHAQYVLTGDEPGPLATVPVGGFAWELYDATMTFEPRAGGESEQVRYRGSQSYRKQPDGSWRIAEKVWNVRGAGDPIPPDALVPSGLRVH
jgi:ketosteroid isomerase-like protein